MKFAISAVVMLALTLGVQSSVLPWGAAPWGGAWGGAHGGVYASHAIAAPAISLSQGPAWGHAGAWSHDGAWGHGGAWGHDGAWGHPAAISLSHGAAWAPHSAWNGHSSVAVHAPAIHAHAHEGQYVAQTRGAVHTAPLAGHINSAAAINVAPAPGTH